MHDWEDLVGKAQQFDEDAFGQLYDKYLRQVYSFVFYRISNQHDAEDLTSEVFIKALEGIHGYDRGKATFLTWLLSIANHLVIDRYRAKSRKPETTFDMESMLIDRDDPEELVMSRFSAAKLWQALNKLTKEQRDVIILRFSLNLSGPEIAKVLGKTPGAVKALQHRGLRTLEKIIAKEERYV